MIRPIEVARGLQKLFALPRRGRWSVGPLLLYLLMAFATLSPFASSRMVESTASDLEAHLSGIIHARAALLERQFPIRVAPAQDDRLRYPIFQFYGNVPYTAGAALTLLPGINPYTAWKLVHLIGLTLAGYFTYRSALTLTGKRIPSIISGAAFIFAPYLWTDIHARFAYAETVSFLLLPVVMHFSLRAFVKRSLSPILLAGVSWNLLALSHNITYVYASAFLGLFFLSMFKPSRRGILRLARVGLGYALGALLTTWYVAPQLAVLKLLNVGEAAGQPFETRVYTTFHTLVSPWLFVPPEAADSTARLGPQVGWPILFGLVVSLLALVISRWAKSRRWMIWRLAGCFAIAFYMAWSPNWSKTPGDSVGNFWLVLPKIFWYVQFTYRILVIVVLFGTMLLAYALAASFPRGMRARSTFVCLFLIGLVGASYYPHHSKMSRGDLNRLIRAPDMGQGGAGFLYLMSMRATAERSIFHPDANIAADAFGTFGHGWLRRTGAVTVAAPHDVTAIVLEGVVPREFVSPVTLTTSIDSHLLSTNVISPGPFRLRIPFVTSSTADGQTIALKLETDRWLRPDAVAPAVAGTDDLSIHFESLTFEAVKGKYLPLIGYEQLRKRISPGSSSKYRLTTNQPSIVQLPVFCYPGLMSVTDNGKSIPYHNLGRIVAVELPEGAHSLAVRFSGMKWANVASGIGWIIVIAGLAIGVVRKIARRRVKVSRPAASKKDAAIRKASRFTPGLAVTGFASVAVGLAFTKLGPLWKELSRPARLDVSVSSFDGKNGRATCAFDDDLSTSWVARGSDPASMTIRLSKSSKISGIVFESRQTALLEAWQNIHVRLFSGEKLVHEQNFSLPQQRTMPAVQIDLPTTPMDRVEMNFSDPVLTTRDGTKSFSLEQVNPGYREIRLLWAK